MLYDMFWPKTDLLSFLAKISKKENKNATRKNAKIIPLIHVLDHVDRANI